MTSSSDTDTLQQLIPLYINGALEAEERLRFEQEMWRNRALRREYHEFLVIERAFRSMERDALPNLDATLDTVMAYARNEMPLPVRTRVKTAASAISQRARRRRTLTWVGWGVAAMPLVIGSGVAWIASHHERSELTTLSTAGPKHQRINVVFADSARQEDVRALLQSVNARIADGPSKVGLVSLELQDASPDVARVMETLRSSPLVVFAEAAY
jgi:hypothetical protein